MKLKRNIAQLLSIGILLNNLSFYSNASISSTEIPNRYEILEGEYITIDDSTEGELVEIELFGNTVQDGNNLEDIQSVGDLYIDESGKAILDNLGKEQYKIDIMSKNYYKKVELERGSLNFTNGSEWDWNSIRSRDFLEYDKYVDETIYLETTLPLHPQSYFTFIYYDENKNYVTWTNSWVTINNGGVYNFKIPKMSGDIKYFRFCKYDAFGDFTNDDVREQSSSFIIKREINDPYETFSAIENKISILLPCQLQKVGNVADRLYWDENKGRYVIEKNILDFSLERTDVTSVILGYYNYTENQISGEILFNIKKSLGIGNVYNNQLGIINSKYRSIPKKTKDIYSEEEVVFLNDGISMFGFMFNKSKLGDNPTSNEVLDYVFNSNDKIRTLTLKKESEIIDTNITSKLKIPTYEGKTYICVDTKNDINPTLKVTIDRLPQIAKNAVEEAETDSIMDNISLARMCVNMLPESIYKDQLQEQLSNIFSTDVILDRKISTVNVDIYIKSENMLSLSLNTNSVTFENYSGVDDIEMLGAVNITINSSLPYQLNAYLPNEIINANKSQTMPIDMLHIKENSERDYQTFANNTDKIVLKDNNLEGNNNIHNIDLKLASNKAYKSDIYKTVIKFEAEQK